MANPRVDHTTTLGAATRRATIDTRAQRIPRAANDNVTSFARGVFRLFPLLVGVVAFLWALSRVFFR